MAFGRAFIFRGLTLALADMAIAGLRASAVRHDVTGQTTTTDIMGTTTTSPTGERNGTG